MDAEKYVASFREVNPEIQLLTPAEPGWAERRETRGQAGQERKPIAIAVPKNADQVAAIIRWATESGVEITVRSGGNDFYGRNAVDGGLVIDMRDIAFINIAPGRKTATIGGGVISKDLVHKFEEEGVVAPVGNTWIVGYVGWATLGGYGPLTNLLGMGYEGIVAAEVVNAKGEIVQASEEMLEGIRGLGGNLGIVTALTIKVYPSRKLFSGMIIFDATPENVKAIVAAETQLDIPEALNLHHFVLKMQDRVLATLFTWSDPDHEKGKEFLQRFLEVCPTPKMNLVQPKTLVEHMSAVPLKCLPWGGQRSLYIGDMSNSLLTMLIAALATMPAEVNMGWGMITHPSPTPANTFGAGSHILLSFSDMVPEEKMLAEARAWNDKLYDELRASKDASLFDGSYPPLTRPEDRTGEQLLGGKWKRARELKGKYDPEGVFRHAIPSI